MLAISPYGMKRTIQLQGNQQIRTERKGKMEEKTSILLVGIGGYGNTYVNALLDHGREHHAEIAGVVDPFPKGCRRYDEIKRAGIPRYDTMEDFYRSGKADLAVISSPIHFHCAQVCMALEKGSHVLCEKPISAMPEEARKMMEVQKSTGLLVGIGFQWSFSRAVRELKEDIRQGDLGKPVLLKTMILWPRDKNYFARSWAGKMSDGQGHMIRDSVANNATAHYLHNMFYVLGDRENTAAVPAKVEAELYRANKIENFDTAAVRVTTTSGAELRYYATHAVHRSLGPVFQYEFENGTAYFDGPESGKGITVRFRDGREKSYGDPNRNVANKLWIMMDAVHGKGGVPCDLHTAYSHVLCIDAMQRSVPNIPDFPDAVRRYDKEKKIVWIDGLYERMKDCCAKGILPSEAGAEWAVRGRQIIL